MAGYIGKDDPIWNFPDNFFTQMHSISSTELGMSMPYVALKTIDASGNVLENISLIYFQNTTDFSQLSKGNRFSDRPVMSLEGLEIKTTNASGYHYYTHVSLKINVHNPLALSNQTAICLLFPGMPMLLEYGWNSTNEFLNNSKETKMFQVVNYSVSLDNLGQVHLTIEGMALNNTYGGTYIGDTGTELKDINDKNNDFGIKYSLDKIERISAYLKKIVKNNDGANNLDVLKDLSQLYSNRTKKIRGSISQTFNKKLLELIKKSKPHDLGKKKKNIASYTVDDIVSTLCDETFDSMVKLFPGVNSFDVYYGDFNDNAGDLAGTSVADFFIAKNNFHTEIKNACYNGQQVFTIQFLLNLLISTFINNSEYITPLMSKKKSENFVYPHVVVYLTNDGNNVILYIIDAKTGVPPTTTKLPKGNASLAKIQKEFADIPKIYLGHGSSFVKNVSLSQMTDEAMKAALIERMYQDSPESIRTPLLDIESAEETPVKALQLPLRGTAEVIGHRDWKPFRSFYLSTGIYIIDAIYKITSVTHKIDREGFFTTIEFIYH